MSDDLKHNSAHKVLEQVSEANYFLNAHHVFDNQAIGDIPYASSTTKISRLPIGANGKILSVASGVPAWIVPGALGASAYIVPSDAPAVIKTFATNLQTAGYPVWVCDGTGDHTDFNTALASYNNIWAMDGTYSFAGTVTVSPGKHLILSSQAVIKPTTNADVIVVLLGGELTGGIVDVQTSTIGDAFTSAAVLLSGLGGATATMFQSKTIIRDILIYGRATDAGGADTGKGLWVKALNGEAIGFAQVDNVKIEYFKEGLYLSTVGTGFINNNTFTNLFLAHQYYPIFANAAGASIGSNNIDAQIQPGNVTQTAIYATSLLASTVKLQITDSNLIATNNVAVFISGSRNDVWLTYSELGKSIYDASFYSTFHVTYQIEDLVETTPSCLKDNYAFAIPFGNESGSVASDALVNYTGSHPLTLYNTPTWGTNAIGAKKLTLNGTTQYGKLVDTFLMMGNKVLTLIYAPDFNGNDNALHVIATWYRGVSEQITLRKTAANDLELFWWWYLPGSANATASWAASFSAGDILIIQMVKDETNDLLELWVNGTKVGTAAATGQVSGNNGALWLGSDATPANYAGGDYYFLGLLNLRLSDTGLENLTNQQADVVGLEIP